MDKRINLNGYMEIVSKEERCSYSMESGSVLVFLCRIDENGVHGRKFYLDEVRCEEKIMIPSLLGKNLLGETWALVISPLRDSVLVEQQLENRESICIQYGARLGMNVSDEEELVEEVIESVERRLFSEEVRMFKNEQEDKRVHESIFDGIRGFFNKDYGKCERDESPSSIYNAVKILCEKNAIPIAPYEDIVENCGRAFKLNDIARISGFVVREVYLEKDWYKNDSGSLLVFKVEEGDECTPVALIREGRSYREYDPEDNSWGGLDEGAYLKNAFMIYRPLPKGNLTILDILRFSLSSVKKRDIISIIVISFLVMVIQMTIPVLYRSLYDTYIPMGYESAVMNLGLLALAVGLSNIFFTLYKGFVQFKTTVSMEFELQNAVYHRLFNLKDSVYENMESADLSKRASSITIVVRKLTSSVIGTVIPLVLSFVYVLYMAGSSWEYTKIGLLYIAAGFIITLLVGVRQVKYSNLLLAQETESSSFLYQLIKGIEKIRIAGRENVALFNYCSRYISQRKLAKKREECVNVVECTKELITSLFIIVIYWKASTVENPMEIGVLISFLAVFGIFANSIFRVCQQMINIGNLLPQLRRNRIFFQGEKGGTQGSNVGKISGDIEVSNVFFSYDKSENYVLKDVSLDIKKGEYIGIVGASGSGKSTLLRLLLGFSEAQSGKIYYDNKDIDDLDKSQLRRKLGVVLQNGELIAGSIYENIAISSSEVSSEEAKREFKKVKEVVKKVGLHQDIKDMPMGLQTIISEGSGAISGGQKQRILIARAIFNDPRILLFDEATSALDNISQRVVCENLEKLKATRVVIAHRLSTVKNCDRIYVMDRGNIIENGSYDELIKKRGFFYELVQRQIA